MQFFGLECRTYNWIVEPFMPHNNTRHFGRCKYFREASFFRYTMPGPCFSVCFSVLPPAQPEGLNIFRCGFFCSIDIYPEMCLLYVLTRGHVRVVSRTPKTDHSNTIPCIFDRHTGWGWVLTKICFLCNFGPRIRIWCCFATRTFRSRVIGVLRSNGFLCFSVYSPNREEFFQADFFIW